MESAFTLGYNFETDRSFLKTHGTKFTGFTVVNVFFFAIVSNRNRVLYHLCIHSISIYDVIRGMENKVVLAKPSTPSRSCRILDYRLIVIHPIVIFETTTIDHRILPWNHASTIANASRVWELYSKQDGKNMCDTLAESVNRSGVSVSLCKLIERDGRGGEG